jgi:murein L,D-transpeptidase YcbB/YkuD
MPTGRGLRALRHWIPKAVIAVLSTAVFCGTVVAETPLEAWLRARIEADVATDSLEVMDERIYARESLRQFYPDRAYRPIWVDENGLLPRGEAFHAWLAIVPFENGLRPGDYHIQIIDQLEEAERLGALVDLELATSDAFLMAGSHLLAGRLNPETLDSEWVADRRHRSLLPLLEEAGATDDPGSVLAQLLPVDAAYRELVADLAALRRQRDDGGWTDIPPGPTLHERDAGPRVAALIARLAESGDLEDAGSVDGFDAAVADAVRRFQTRHGLVADAVVGQGTLRALNVPIQRRIDQIIVNLERWRWLPEDLGAFYVLVNIAGFSLDVIENGESILDMRVVVGQPYLRTPVFSGQISYLVLNPYWEVPPSIATRDKLPLIRKDPGFLESQGYEVLEGWGDQERRIDPLLVDWASISARNFPYRLRQKPGPYNALGRIKFMFPNKFAVYLHDTPARELFAENARAFSSGCIRLESPQELALLLLRDQPQWSRAGIDAALATSGEQTVRLTHRVPVHLLYWTAWIDRESGQLNFREDIYGRDEPVLRELAEMPPT